MRSFVFIAPALVGARAILNQTIPVCKLTPLDATWPCESEWNLLNATIDGFLLRTVPVASSCWPGNPLGSTVGCNTTIENWSNATWHSQQPESIDHQIYANNTCLPNDAPGYSSERGCSMDAFPQYIVNATDASHVAYAMKWASDRNIRITIRGTGHDLNGRQVNHNGTKRLRLISFSGLAARIHSQSGPAIYVASSDTLPGHRQIIQI